MRDDNVYLVVHIYIHNVSDKHEKIRVYLNFSVIRFNPVHMNIAKVFTHVYAQNAISTVHYVQKLSKLTVSNN